MSFTTSLSLSGWPDARNSQFLEQNAVQRKVVLAGVHPRVVQRRIQPHLADVNVQLEKENPKIQ